METFWQDIRYGLRMLVKSPGFTAVAVLSLGLGIGANSIIFTMINAIFLQPIPVKEPARVVMVFGTDENARGPFQNFLPISRPNILDYRDKNQVLSDMAFFSFAALGISGEGEPEQVGAQVVSGNYFDVLGVPAAAGRTFAPEEDKTYGTHPVVVLSDGLWRRRFGADRSIVGREIRLNNLPYTVIGVTPPGFRGTNALGGPDLWVPLAMRDHVFTGLARDWFDSRRALIFNSFGRMKPGVTFEQAQQAMSLLGKQLEQEYPTDNEKRNVRLVPLPQAAINPNVRDNFVAAGGILMGAVGLVLLIACSNVANLLLARGAAREREIGIRIALGAGRGRLVRQLLTESVVLALAAGAAGLLIAYWGRDVLWAFRPPQLGQGGNAISLALDRTVLGFTLGLSLLTGILFGLVPALQSTRHDLAGTLKDRSRPGSGRARVFSARNILVMGQVSLSLVALLGAGLFLRSLWNAQQTDLGFPTRDLMVLSFDVGTQGYDEPRGKELYRQTVERLRSLPMVQAAAVASNPPFGGGFMRTVFPEGVDNRDRRNGVLILVNSVDPYHHETVGIPVLRGRGFTESDVETSPMVAVVNETMAQRFWPKEDAVGRRFTFFDEAWVLEVVGVARNSKYFTIGEEPQPIVYLPMRQHYSPAVTLHVRTKGDSAAAMAAVRSEVQAQDRNLPLVGVNTLERIIAQALWAPRMGAALLGIFGGLALFLAALGIYGVMSYSVTQRTQEIGIRMALGAQERDVLGLILRQSILIVSLGLGAGLALGIGAVTAGAAQMKALLFDVEGVDPLVFGGTLALLAAVALAASLIPARRAARVDPIVALRYE